MIAVLVNFAAVLAGGGIGLLLKKGIPDKLNKGVMTAMALCVLYIGISGTLDCSNALIMVIAMALGAVVGTLIDLDGKLEKFSRFTERKLSKNGEGGIAVGFMTSTLLFCVGAMAIVGSLNAGLEGSYEVLFTKSVIDGVSACMLACTLGAGVLLSAFSVALYQGAIVALSGLLATLLTNEALIGEVGAVGSLMIVALGLNMLGLTKIKVANLLPALIFVPPVYFLLQYIM